MSTLVETMRREFASLSVLGGKPDVIFCGKVFWTSWRNVIEYAEHRRVMLWKYRKLRGMPLPPEPVAV